MAVSWGVATLPSFWRDYGIEKTAQRVILGESFLLDNLVALLPLLDSMELETICRPAITHADAIIRLNIAETTLVSNIANVDERLLQARSAIIRSLACSPSDSFLWLGLYWVDAVSKGLNEQSLKFLRRSYELGANEGWIIVKRNRAALAIYPSLPPDLAEMVLAEFQKLFEPGLVLTAVDLFLGPGWPIRDILLARVANAPQSQRQNFSNLLRARGYDIAVPGVVQKEGPWF
jgi:hypothetical protein